MTEIAEAQISENSLPECPPECTYVLLSIRQCVMQWVHNSPSAGHPGITATIQLLSNKF